MNPRSKRSIDVLIYILVIGACLIALSFVFSSSYQFNDTKAVYQGF